MTPAESEGGLASPAPITATTEERSAELPRTAGVSNLPKGKLRADNRTSKARRVGGEWLATFFLVFLGVGGGLDGGFLPSFLSIHKIKSENKKARRSEARP